MYRDCDNEKFASFGVAVDATEVYDVEAVGVHRPAVSLESTAINCINMTNHTYLGRLTYDIYCLVLCTRRWDLSCGLASL